MRLLKAKIIRGIIHCDTGLHIGGSKEMIQIGGIDDAVIKHPITGEPYIPGSSLKGKIRSILEMQSPNCDISGGRACNCGNCEVCRIFGSFRKTSQNPTPTKIIVRDAMLSQKSRDALNERDEPYIEIKTQTAVNRTTGMALNGTLQTFERVPAGVMFDLEIVLQVYDTDNEAAMIQTVKTGLDWVQKTYLGKGGSRGSGKVSFRDLTIDGQPFSLE